MNCSGSGSGGKCRAEDSHLGAPRDGGPSALCGRKQYCKVGGTLGFGIRGLERKSQRSRCSPCDQDECHRLPGPQRSCFWSGDHEAMPHPWKGDVG